MKKTPPPAKGEGTRPWLTALVLVYAAAVFGADWFVPKPMFHGADLYKVTAWFVIPFACCVVWMDWGYYGVKRWKKIDYAILGAAILLELIAVLAVRFMPVLRANLPHLSRSALLPFTIWNLSWIVGWEFTNRYVLLRRLNAQWPKYGWLLVPVYEAAYHLNWPSLWMPLGMAAFSLIATWWSKQRNNGLLPFLAHLIVELQLTVFLLFA